MLAAQAHAKAFRERGRDLGTLTRCLKEEIQK